MTRNYVKFINLKYTSKLYGVSSKFLLKYNSNQYSIDAKTSILAKKSIFYEENLPLTCGKAAPAMIHSRNVKFIAE